jgi:predicted phage tail protein
MFLSYVSRTALVVALVVLGVAVVAVDRWSGVAAQSGPPAPANLTASVDGSTVSLSWSHGGGQAGGLMYQLEAGSRAGAADLVVTRMSSTSAVATNVPDGTYYVRVRAGNANGVSRPSNELTVRVGCTNGPAAPAGLAAQVSGTSVVLSWRKVSGATGYVLEAGSAPGLANVATAPVKGTSLSTTAPAGIYYARVRALNKCGSSAPSNEVTVTVGGTPAPTPTPTPTPTPGTGTIFGIVDPTILGTCSAATHDKWVVDGGDGFKYRTWHPQTDPTGCVYGHEHGDNPASIQEPTIAASPVRFGYIGRRHPMAGEPNGH